MAKPGASQAEIVGTPRPKPSEHFLADFYPYNRLIPADGLYDWVHQNIIAETGVIHNPDHIHLDGADIAFMWAQHGFTKKGRTVLGQAEEVMFRAGGWQKSRMEQQMNEWFGHQPDYIITLAADYCSQCSDLEFCALLEHELYHVAQAVDDRGAPKFNRETGMPVLTLRSHDVEEFVGVVRRYGASKDVQEMVDAAKRPAEVAHIDVARACGTCMLKLA
ncbi:putative metallopeptidase [Klebsiella variicola]|uniref:putative metallopeptidase n=1 Tax=Klebsiella variicola TaxID=244366 RepID=UPI002B06099C|nr:putative metallopeptidase [Klebsiella variicola]